MSLVKTEPYGSWKSKISAEVVVSDFVKMSDLKISSNGTLFWVEMRSKENGRGVICHLQKRPKDILPHDYNARTSVHEYGGAPYCVNNEDLYFVNYSDQKIYKLAKDIEPVFHKENCRFADLTFDIKRDAIFMVREEHANEVKNSICMLDLKSREMKEIASGYDFYSSLVLSDDKKKLAFLCWNNPNMPWDSTDLMVADFKR